MVDDFRASHLAVLGSGTRGANLFAPDRRSFAGDDQAPAAARSTKTVDEIEKPGNPPSCTGRRARAARRCRSDRRSCRRSGSVRRSADPCTDLLHRELAP